MTRNLSLRVRHIHWIFAIALLSMGATFDSASSTSLQNRPAIDYLADQSKFVLDASGIVTTGAPVTFLWSLTARPSGSAASIIDNNAPVAALQTDGAGPYTVELTIVEAGVPRAPIILQLTRDNIEPVSAIEAVGGAAPVLQGAAINLSGVASYDPDGDRLQYRWALVSKPVGSVAAPSNQSGPNTSFVPDVAGAYEIALTVTDKAGAAARDTVKLVTDEGLTIANAGPDQKAALGETVFTDAFASIQTQGRPLASAWQIVSAPAASAAALSDGALSTPKATGRQLLTPLVAGQYLLAVNVTGGGSSSTDTVLVSTGPNANAAPQPYAGADKFILAGEAVVMDASRSTDADGDSLSYRWSIQSSPVGSAASISTPSLPKALLSTDLAGDYVVQLSVSDGKSVRHSTVSY